jgi:hypothetical protein
MMGEDVGRSMCVADVTCGVSEEGLLGLEATLECSATVLAASMVTVIGVMTQM